MANSRLSRIVNLLGPTDDLTSPLWTLRLSPLLALIGVLLAELVWKSGHLHLFCLDLAIGQIGVLSISSFNITAVKTRKSTDDSGIQQLHLSR